MASEKRLLALGGPKNLEWLPELQTVMRVPIPNKPFRFEDGTALEDMPEHKTARYIKERLVDPATGKTRMVYRYEHIEVFEADLILKEWLVVAFINMED